MTNNDRIKAERALADLQALGFNVKAQWRELTDRVEKHERGVPTPDDLLLQCPTSAPKTVEHFKGQVPEVLSVATMWAGHHYSLSPGQRRWFRDFTGLTPAMTITVGWVELWPGTQSPRAFKVVSDVHVDPRNRKHVLTEWVVRDVVAFFKKSAEFDEEERVAKVLRWEVGPVNVWRGSHKRAVKELTGRQPIGDVEDIEIVEIRDDEWIVITDFMDSRFEFDKDEFLGVVADIENGTRKGVGSAASGSSKEARPTQKLSLDELMAQLSSGQLPL